MFCCSQVLIVRGSLDVLDMLAFAVFDASVSEFLFGDGVDGVCVFGLRDIVPSNSAHVLHACHLFVSQIGKDFEHVTAVAVLTEHVVVNQHL